ncbi:MBG domain-containing protein [Pseudochelatococcus sp. B33]
MVGKSETVSRRLQRRLSRLAVLGRAAGVGLVFAAAVSSPAALAQTLPTGAQVLGGQAAVAGDGPHLDVRQSTPAAIISWQTFSIGGANSVRFDNGAGATLNRVRGNVASQIDGSLTATGSLYLVNPAGVAVGPTGRIETGGSFLGSTLDLADEEFAKAAKGETYTLKGDSAASVVNAGRIGSLGGDVALVGRTVENTGDIDAPRGTAALAAGTEVLVQDRALDGGRFVVKAGRQGSNSGTSARNSGSIRAAEVELRANGGNVYALAGNRKGVIVATGTATRGGRVFLTAGDAGAVEVTQRVAARKADANAARPPRGGEIRVAGRNVKVAATLDASGRAPSAAPGVLPPARPSALDGDGGTVIVTGEAITLADTARLDVSGARGGVALVGGDFQGGKDAAKNYVAEKVATARTLTVAAGATVAADGADDGGRIVLWSDDLTAFAGHVSATGETGRGGDAEVSGKAVLSFRGTANLKGPLGTGTLLLDPHDLEIVAGSGGDAVRNGHDFDPAGDSSTLGADTLTALLETAHVTVTTNGGGSQAGNITVNADIAWTNAFTLTLQAHSDIIINNPITAAKGGLALDAADGTIAINAAITAVNGSLTLRAADGDVDNATITTGESGAIDVGMFYLESGAWVQKDSLPGFTANDFRIAGGQAVTDYAPEPTVTFLRVTDGDGSAATPYLIADVYGLQGIATVLDKHYKLTADIDASGTANWYGGTGFSPIGVAGGYFTGSFDGLGHVVKGLTINRPQQRNVGLFSVAHTGATIRNVSLDDVEVTGQNYVGAAVAVASGLISSVNVSGTVEGQNFVGLLTGENGGTITGVYTQGAVFGRDVVGGVVGQFYNGGTISNSASAAQVTGTGNNIGGVGGLVGRIVFDSNGAHVSIENSWAAGNVVSGAVPAGGLVGFIGPDPVLGTDASVSITNAYAAGRVEGADYAGGLVGELNAGLGTITITNVYATGKVTGDVAAGGLIGHRISGGIIGSFWDKDTTEKNDVIGVDDLDGADLGATGLTAADAYLKDTYTEEGWIFAVDDPWYIVDGDTRPMLRMTLDVLGNPDGGNTYTIRNAEQLQLIRAHTDADTGYAAGRTYVLANDIDFAAAFTDSSVWRTATTKDADANLFGFVPIGTFADGIYFGGVLDGRGHIIQGLVIHRPQQSYVGLFGSTGSATIENLSLGDVRVTGEGIVGGLVGTASTTAIDNVRVTGSVTGTGNEVGGLVGGQSMDGGSITNAWADVDVTGANFVGGLVGAQNTSDNIIANSYATGNVQGSVSVGGLLGGGAGAITGSYATGAVTGTSNVGGLAGHDDGTITDAYATGAVTGEYYVGGLVGYLVAGTITNAWASGDVAAEHGDAGGLVGRQDGGRIENVHAMGDVTGGITIGGLVGWHRDGTISTAYATGDVAGTEHVGGLVGGQGIVGEDGAMIVNVYATGRVHASDRNAGGLVGTQVAGVITNAYAAGRVTGGSNLGGLVGHHREGDSTITASFWDKDGTRLAAAIGLDEGTGERDITGLTTAQITSTGYFMNIAEAKGWDFDTVWAPPGDTYRPELYALSKVIRVHADGDATATYGANAGTWVGGTPADFAANPGLVLSGLHVGTYGAVEVTGLPTSGSNGYRFIYTAGVEITKAALTVTVNSAAKTYDATMWSGGNGVTYTGLAGGDTAAALGGALAWGGSAQGAQNAGSYTLTASGLTSANYDITYVSGALTIGKAALTVTANDGAKTYDAAPWSGGNGVTYTGFAGGETAAALGGALAWGGSAQGAADAGSYTLTASGLTSANYDITYVSGALTIGKAPLTVTANDAAKTYDAAPWSGGSGVTYAGFAGGETAAALGGALVWGGSAQGATDAGSYTLTASGLTSANYDIAYVDGALTIGKALLTINPAAGQQKTIDDDTFRIAFDATGWQGGDGSALLSGALGHDGTAPGQWAITLGSLAAGGNYTLALVAGSTLELLARPIPTPEPDQPGTSGDPMEQLPWEGLALAEIATGGNGMAIQIARNLTALPVADAVRVTATFVETATVPAQRRRVTTPVATNSDTRTIGRTGDEIVGEAASTAGADEDNPYVRKLCDASGIGGGSGGIGSRAFVPLKLRGGTCS